MAKFVYSSPKIIDRHLANLAKIIGDVCDGAPPNQIDCGTALAATLGYDNLRHLKSAAKATEIDKRMDEDLSDAELQHRRGVQTKGLAKYFEKIGVKLPADEIVKRWRPTSRWPFAETITKDARARYLQSDLLPRVLGKLNSVKGSGKNLTAQDVHEIRTAFLTAEPYIKSQREVRAGACQNQVIFNCNWLTQTAGQAAVALLKRNSDKDTEFGVEIFEILVGIECFPAYADFVRCYLAADLTPVDLERAWALIHKAYELMESGEEDYVNKGEKRAFYADMGHVLMRSSKEENKRLAIKMLKKGVEIGSPKSALILAHVYWMTEAEEEQYPYFKCDFIKYDKEKAEYYWFAAIRLGYNPHTDNFEGGK